MVVKWERWNHAKGFGRNCYQKLLSDGYRMPSAMSRNQQNLISGTPNVYFFVWRKDFLKYAAKIFSMFLNRAGVDYDVINVDLRKRAAGSEKIITGPLKSARSVARSKSMTLNWYDPNFVEGSCDKCDVLADLHQTTDQCGDLWVAKAVSPKVVVRGRRPETVRQLALVREEVIVAKG